MQNIPAKIVDDKYYYIDLIYSELAKVVVGQKKLIDSLLIGLLTEGHILIEGVPGLAKTLAVKSLASIISSKFSRIQFTPDLLPADIIGTMIFNQQQAEFSIKLGPIFANFILADEINRAPAKVQSALLEAMQEKQVTIADKTFQLPDPFFVLATQNPLEQEGTYPLSEAQTDRFMLKTIITYPNREEERKILRQNNEGAPTLSKILDNDILKTMQNKVKAIYLDEKIENYILDIVQATRTPQEFSLEKLQNLIEIGASPRATISIAKAAKAMAFLNKRDYVLPKDIQTIAADAMRHRIGLTFEAEAEQIKVDDIINEILTKIATP
ncbi:MAG: AAA domain-containing protein [Ignavibacteria bacterium]|jgi:MoxR-like ATPase|nr:AAA domain-containing protein [Ignavibacteria bacterium]